MMDLDPRLILLSEKDNIAVLGQTLHQGEVVMLSGQQIEISETLGMGHKLAIRPITAGSDVLKYGLPIGFAATDITLGAHVHVHNLTSRYTTVEILE